MLGKSRFPFFSICQQKSRPTLKRNRWNRSGRNWMESSRKRGSSRIGWTPPTARRCLKVGRDEWRKPREQRVRGLGRVGSTLRRNANFHLAAFLVGRQCSWLNCRLSVFPRLIVKLIVRWRIVQLFLSLSALFFRFSFLTVNNMKIKKKRKNGNNRKKFERFKDNGNWNE